jgi:ABC-type phosphate transport system substrate-binding protein
MVRPSTRAVARRTALAAVALALELAAAATAGAEVVAVVSAHSSVRTLSRGEIADIFLGRTDRFPNGDAAVPIDQAEGSASRDEFYAKFADKSPAQIKAFWSKIIFTGRGQPPKTVAGGAEVKKLIAANPDAIGYIDEKLVDSSVRVIL